MSRGTGTGTGTMSCEVGLVDGWVGMIGGEMHCILGAGVLLDRRQSRRIRVIVVFIMKNDRVVRHGTT
jgi:hypothetical protein